MIIESPEIQSSNLSIPLNPRHEEIPVERETTLAREFALVSPAGKVVITGLDQIVDLARELKRDGSDFLIEEDLAAIFGQDEFYKAVRPESTQLLYASSQISLNAGLAATVRRALKDRYHMSCVIQLLFLIWVHEERSLAAALIKNMLRRCELEVPGATPDADYERVLTTLQACSSQTSQYRWEDLVSEVESRFKKSKQWFSIDGSPLRCLPTNLLLGAMDYLYLAQSLPEDCLITVEVEAGMLPIIVWAHYILGLTVLVKNSPDGDVAFGGNGRPQVIISWNTSDISDMIWADYTNMSPRLKDISQPTMYLLNAKLSVLLTSEPGSNENEDDDPEKIFGYEFCRLKDYGTRYLQRLFNKVTLVPNDALVLPEFANLAVTFAILLSRAIRRVPFPARDYVYKDKKIDVPSQCYLSTEHWRLFDASSLLF